MSGTGGNTSSVAVGDKFRGVTGNVMVVIAIHGDRCRLRYLGINEPEWWDFSDEVAEYLDRVLDSGRQDQP